MFHGLSSSNRRTALDPNTTLLVTTPAPAAAMAVLIGRRLEVSRRPFAEEAAARVTPLRLARD
jgi:hypothetical protein